MGVEIVNIRLTCAEFQKIQLLGLNAKYGICLVEHSLNVFWSTSNTFCEDLKKDKSNDENMRLLKLETANKMRKVKEKLLKIIAK